MKVNNRLNDNLLDVKKNVTLNPNFLTGLSDAEACFSVTRRKNKGAKFGVRLSKLFIIKKFMINKQHLVQVGTAKQ